MIFLGTMARRRGWILVPLLGGCLWGGCFWAEWFRPLAAASSDWYPVGPVRKPLEEITRAAQYYLTRAGYVIPAFDPGARRLETGWDTHLSSHWREGFRTKVEVEFQDMEDGSTLIQIRSYREFNEESRYPMIAEKASWIGAATDDKQAPLIPEPAIKLQQHLKLKLVGLGNE